MEIERKWRLKTLPSRTLFESWAMLEQAYLISSDGELRVRRFGDDFFLTIKGPGSIVRRDWEKPIPAWAYLLVQRHCVGSLITKTRYFSENSKIEVDEYHGHLEGLVILECEFPSLEKAEEFELPGWAGEAVEVTEEPAYKNKNLALLKSVPVWPE